MRIIYIYGYQVFNYRKAKKFFKEYWALVVANTLVVIFIARLLALI